MTPEETKLAIIEAGEKAIKELIRVAKEDIPIKDEDALSADKLKNAAATKKLAIFDAFEILNRIEEERNIITGNVQIAEKKGGFAERRGK
jgi:hypothetical protein